MTPWVSSLSTKGGELVLCRGGAGIDADALLRERRDVEQMAASPEHQEQDELGFDLGRDEAGALACPHRSDHLLKRGAEVPIDQVREPWRRRGTFARDHAGDLGMRGHETHEPLDEHHQLLRW